MKRPTSIRFRAYADIARAERDEKLQREGRIWTPRKSKPERVFAGRQREHIVSRVSEVLKQWTSSPFENEGPCRHGIRSALCLDGVEWPRADNVAAAIVAEGLGRINAHRPTWEQGQREYVIPKENCSWCSIELPDEMMAEKRHVGFCSEMCARSAIQHRSLQHLRKETRAYSAALDVIDRARHPAVPCEQCGKKFRPLKASSGKYCSHRCFARSIRVHADRECAHCKTIFTPSSADARFCSNRCGVHSRMLPEQPCEICSTPFRPHTSGRGEKFCSPKCRMIGRSLARYSKSCDFCGDHFEGNSSKALYCSPRCRLTSNRMDKGRVPSKLAPHVFDHFVAVPVNASRPTWLTPERFDELLAA